MQILSNLRDYIQRQMQDIWHRLKNNYWWIVFFVMLFFLALLVDWGHDFAWLRDFITGTSYPLTILVVCLALLFGIFADRWLQPIYIPLKWATEHWKILILLVTLALFLLNVMSYISTHYNKEGVFTVEVWSEDKDGLKKDAVALQYRVSYNNSIALEQFAPTTLPNLAQDPNVELVESSLILSGKTRSCRNDILNPHLFPVLSLTPDISIPNSSKPDELSRERPKLSDIEPPANLSFTVLGETIEVPLRRILPYINYRKLKIKAILTSRSSSNMDNIRIIVESADEKSWSVEGPAQDWPQLTKFLAYRIRFDDNVTQPSLLALWLGNEAFEERDYVGALGFYRLADNLAPNDNVTPRPIQIMLALTQYQLEKVAEAIKILDQYIQTAESIIPTTYLYRACLYAENNNPDKAQESIDIFKDSLPQPEKVIAPPTQERDEVRAKMLNSKEVLGPGSIFSMNTQLQKSYYFSGTQVYTASLEISNIITISNETRFPFGNMATPRQIFAIDNGAYYLTQDGKVYFFDDNPQNPKPIIKEAFYIDRANLILVNHTTTPNTDLLYTGGIHQIFPLDDTVLLMVDRFGRVLRYNRENKKLQAVGEFLNARQIFPDGNTLYLLSEDGRVGRTDLNGDFTTFEELVADSLNREITAFNNVLYILRENGNIWRYQEHQDEQRNLIIDTGTDTKSIFAAAQGLFILKDNGEVWLIRSSQNPTQADLIKQETTIRENSSPVAISVADSTLFTVVHSSDNEEVLQPEAYQISLSSEKNSEETETQTTEIVAIAATATASNDLYKIEATQTIIAQSTQIAQTEAVATAQANATATAETIATATAQANAIVRDCNHTLNERSEIRKVWVNYIGELGCSKAPVFGYFLWQRFENANVFWSANKRLYVIAKNDGTWVSFSRDSLNNQGSCPTDHRVRSGMSVLYCSTEGKNLGEPEPEDDQDDALTFQDFDRGLIWINERTSETFIFFGTNEGKFTGPQSE